MEHVQHVQPHDDVLGSTGADASVQAVSSDVLNGAQRLNDLNPPPAAQPLTIVGWLWKSDTSKTKYKPEHANIWARMIDRHLTLSHRFVLVTDQPDADFDPLITPLSIWDDWRSIQNERWGSSRPHCYVRLKAYSEAAAEFFGPRFASVDLDCVVRQNLDPLFDRSDDFLIYRRHVQAIPFDQINCYQASMWLMNAGARKKVWEDFRGFESIRAAAAYMGTDQAWLRHTLGPEENGWTQKDGVYGWPSIRQEHKKRPPADARIVFFYGGIKPWNIIEGKTTFESPWIAENYH